MANMHLSGRCAIYDGKWHDCLFFLFHKLCGFLSSIFGLYLSFTVRMSLAYAFPSDKNTSKSQLVTGILREY